MEQPNPTHPLLLNWQAAIEAVRDALTQMVEDKSRMAKFSEMARANPRLATSGHPFLIAIRRWYTESLVMGVRRQTDFKHSDVLSLVRVLKQMTQNHQVLTVRNLRTLYENHPIMSKYLKTWPYFLDVLPDWKFVPRDAGDEASIDPAYIEVDIRALTAVAKRVIIYASNVIAHKKDLPLEHRQVTYAELRGCVDEFERVAIKYISLFTGGVYTSLDPIDQFSWYSIFKFPWYVPGPPA